MSSVPLFPDVPTLAVAFAEKGTFNYLRAICPHCGATAVFEVFPYQEFNAPTRANGEQVNRLISGRCVGCQGLVIGLRVVGDGAIINRLLWPLGVPPDNSPPNLDDGYRAIYNQARYVLASSPMAAAVLARRCVQHVIRTRLGITRASLFQEIEEAAKRDDLSKQTRAALDHVRHIGNWGAHPVQDQASQIIEVSPEDAEYTLHVLELLFDDLYVKPARIAVMDAKVRRKMEGA